MMQLFVIQLQAPTHSQAPKSFPPNFTNLWWVDRLCKIRTLLVLERSDLRGAIPNQPLPKQASSPGFALCRHIAFANACARRSSQVQVFELCADPKPVLCMVS